MPGKVERDLFDWNPDADLSEREERCQKAIKAVFKAIFMRLTVCGLLIWAVFCSDLDLWVIGLMLLMMLMNLSGILPLASELKKQRAVWKQLLEEEE